MTSSSPPSAPTIGFRFGDCSAPPVTTAVGGAGLAPDHLPALLFGPHGVEGLTRIRPDVYAADGDLFQVLFPPLTADVLSYYLPYQ